MDFSSILFKLVSFIPIRSIINKAIGADLDVEFQLESPSSIKYRLVNNGAYSAFNLHVTVNHDSSLYSRFGRKNFSVISGLERSLHMKDDNQKHTYSVHLDCGNDKSKVFAVSYRRSGDEAWVTSENGLSGVNETLHIPKSNE